MSIRVRARWGAYTGVVGGRGVEGGGYGWYSLASGDILWLGGRGLWLFDTSQGDELAGDCRGCGGE